MPGPLLIINADDWGRSIEETDAALECFRAGRLTSATAMVHMADSARAAEIARIEGLPIGLHLNLSQPFDGGTAGERLRAAQERVIGYLAHRRLAALLYNPFVAADFEYCFKAQLEAFERLYGRPPSHVDGHHHQHLCANMLLGGVIPSGQRVRRSFHVFPGEKSVLNRAYRGLVNALLARHHVVSDHFFALSQCLAAPRLARALALARERSVEMMTHPVRRDERECLLGAAFAESIAPLRLGTYADLGT